MQEMQKVKVTFHPDYKISEVDPRIYGSFVEHMARCVYTGIYEPSHPTADKNGFRTDVMELVKELDCPVMRYPGGNFLSGYNWEDGIGSKESRPRRPELAWQSIETNQMGTDEFMEWCRLTGTAPMMAVNLGTRGADAARNLVEYTNFAGGTYYSDLRAKNGHKEPYNVKLWCLGNEMDGTWQIEHKTADEYGRIATETAKLMKWTDPSIELVACGSSGFGMSTMGKWEATVLEHCYEHVEYISLHSYYGQENNDLASYLAVGSEIDRYIKSVVSACDYVKAIKRGKKDIMLSYDEWNVTNAQRTPRSPKWAEVRAIGEAVYTKEDAVSAGGHLIAFLKNAGRVKVACEAQLVNLLGLIMTKEGGAAWRQTIFYPFAITSKFGRGTSMLPVISAPEMNTARYGDVSIVDVAGVENNGEITLFIINRQPDKSAEIEFDLRAYSPKSIIEHIDLSGSGKDINDDEIENVKPIMVNNSSIDRGILTSVISPASWNVIRVSL